MLAPITKEELYEYRLNRIIQQLHKEEDRPGFKTGDDLFDWIHKNDHRFCQLIIDDMIQWMDEDEWLVNLQEN